ncbi:MAG: 30S ribosomal protein S15 [Pseudomonadota bacterium]|jgi:small subunit ribosomal protein S15|nr:30S ribosomal protein S15 [Gammaproteobacteria bacterium]MBS55577.1 30S ribosomal protein S15 [Gammaproteobacteria bacterium]MEC8170288.1 30S ribosomal protein S15 [Pseudomonadota bacterium]GIS46571.1 MAG: 30S ribosomal protein S15 [Gammaproteobacteria bacterium]GIS46738.1 MAG: 30S ribosomal protein S15 [Gammaproteobacteria bacterium]|tara:strand:- start:1485 stop:1754 length:270 start_codon:yes stop_codon:yes gene_type:complete
MAISNITKQNIVKKYGKSEKDCGSSEVQIALLTENINSLGNHFTNNKKDIHSRRGLLKMIMKRRSLMKYLKKKNLESYNNLIKELGLRK